MKNKSLFHLISFLFLFITTQGCFEIVHYVDKNSDGTMKVQWMFSISTAFSKEKGAGVGGDNLGDRIKSSEEEMKNKMKDIADDIEFKSIETEYESGVRMSFTVKDPQKASKVEGFDEGLPILPLWNETKKQLTFKFTNKDKMLAKKLPAKKSKNDDSDSTEESSESGKEDPTQKIVTMIMSSASYKIVLGSNFKPKKVQMHGLSSKKTMDLEIIHFGSVSMIKVPFASILMEETEGFSIIVKM
jgi:hypothetical protein